MYTHRLPEAHSGIWEKNTADKAMSQHADTDGTDIFLAYQDKVTGNVKIGKVVPNPTRAS